MIDNQPVPETLARQSRKIPIQERSVLVGDVIVVNGYGVNRNALKQRFAEGDYEAHETAHFLLLTRETEPKTILVHWFTPEELNADIKHFLMYELQPSGLLKQPSDFGKLVSGIIGSFFSKDAHAAWHEYGAKTLQRFLLFLSTAHTPTVFNFYATIGVFANLYQRVLELCVGESFLDAGCESGMLALLVAERIPFMTNVRGVDIQSDMLTIAKELAEEWHLTQVQFAQADLLNKDFSSVGQFDTVAALHVIEHFTQTDMYRVLANLVKVTTKRLILAVPYEKEPETIYEHKQVFTRATLEAVGQWCLEQWGGTGRMWCEECEGGLLLIERGSPTK